MEPVAVLGGGPAAGAAALRLARAGMPVDLYRPGRPGEKPCGGAVPIYLADGVSGFDPATLPAVAGPPALLENAAGRRVELPLEGIRVYRRRELDAALLDAAVAAGARLLPARAERLALDAGGATVAAAGSERRYAWVVGADGARGLSRRTIGLPSRGESLTVGATLSGLRWERLVLSFPDAADAYLWIFPRPAGASVGVAYSRDLLSEGAARSLLTAFLGRFLPGPLASWPGPRYRYPIPVFGPWTVPGLEAAVRRRVLLVGDAAAVADPMTREGIRFAVLTGAWAAESLLSGKAGTYPERVAAALGEEMGRSERARELFFDDPIGQWMVPVSRFLPPVRAVLGDLLACQQPYRGLRRRLASAALGFGGPRRG